MAKDEQTFERTVQEALRRAKLLFSPRVANQSGTGNASTTQAGLVPPVPSDATEFLNGAAPPTYAHVKDSDLALSDVATNNVSTAAHGFAPKAPNDATKYLDGTGAYSTPATGGGLTDHPDQVPGAPATADDEFGGAFYTSEVALDTTGTRFSGALAWSWVNQGTATAAISKSNLIITAPNAGANIRLILQTVSAAGTWRYVAKIRMLAPASGSSFAGMTLRQSSSGKLTSVCTFAQGATGPLTSGSLAVFNHTNPTTFSATVFSQTYTRAPDYFAVEYDGTNYIFEASADGIIWYRLGTVAKTSFMTSTGADQIGIGLDTNGAANTVAVDYFRRVA